MTRILSFTKMKEAKNRVEIWAKRIKMSISLTYSFSGVLENETLPYSNALWGNQAHRVALYWRWCEGKSGVKVLSKQEGDCGISFDFDWN